MGLYDESWCSGCGTSQPYSKDEVQCGECATETTLSDVRYIIKQRLDEYLPILDNINNIDGFLSNDESSDQDWYQGYVDALEFVLMALDKKPANV
jgi:hypothetical protein